MIAPDSAVVGFVVPAITVDVPVKAAKPLPVKFELSSWIVTPVNPVEVQVRTNELQVGCRVLFGLLVPTPDAVTDCFQLHDGV